jgi:cobalt-zinc-cadmium efflux system membrane fusion protein
MLSACGADTTPRLQRKLMSQESRLRILTTASVTRAAPFVLPSVPGRVSTIDALTARVYAPLTGRIVKSFVQLGDHVRRGDRLLEIRSQQLPSLHQDVAAARAFVSARQNRLAHLEQMLAARVGNANDVLLARGELERAKIEESAARSRLSSLRIGRTADPASYYVFAPADGTLLTLHALTGSIVGPDRAAIAVVARLEEVFAIADVPLFYARELKSGMSAVVESDVEEGVAVEGRIEHVADVVRPDLQTVSVRVRVRNHPQLWHANAFVHLSFTVADHDVVRVPSTALVRDGSTSVVFVETAPGRYERRTVEPGLLAEPWAEIRSGVELGERVVIEHPSLLLNVIDGES